MDCTRARDLLSAYLDDDLPERGREGMADHLGRCPRCAEEERALRETLSLLRNLPAVSAPPELLRGITLRIGEETARTPLWKRLFLPAHIKIPLEAAAVALVLVLAYGIQKEIPATKTPPAPPASVESGKPEAGTDRRADRSEADILRKKRTDAPGRNTEEPQTQGVTEEVAPPETERASVAKPFREKKPSSTSSRIPAIPATRVSTGGEAIERAFPRETPEREAPAPRMVAAPPPHLLRSLLHGKGVTIEVSPDARVGMENRIAELVLRLGGAVRGEGKQVVVGASGEAQPPIDLVQVQLPADSEEAFLEELETLGAIPPEETPGREDTFPGSSSGSVVYTVRIRVR